MYSSPYLFSTFLIQFDLILLRHPSFDKTALSFEFTSTENGGLVNIVHICINCNDTNLIGNKLSFLLKTHILDTVLYIYKIDIVPISNLLLFSQLSAHLQIILGVPV